MTDDISMKMMMMKKMMINNNNDDFLTVREAAEIVRVEPRTIRGWLYERRTLSRYKAGGRVLIKRSDLMALVERQESGGKEKKSNND